MQLLIKEHTSWQYDEEEAQNQRQDVLLRLTDMEKKCEKEVKKFIRKIKQTIYAYNFADLDNH